MTFDGAVIAQLKSKKEQLNPNMSKNSAYSGKSQNKIPKFRFQIPTPYFGISLLEFLRIYVDSLQLYLKR
jgi:hypothetical protein